jgi:hypothetical protein
MSDAPAKARPLRLLAEDAADLEVLSAAVQDAVVRLTDVSFEGSARRFTLSLNRFRWEAGARTPERVRAALRFAGVLGVKSRRAPATDPDAVVSILAVTFEPCGQPEDPSGAVHLKLAGGGDIRLDVECIDAILVDVSEPWAAIRKPRHEV